MDPLKLRSTFSAFVLFCVLLHATEVSSQLPSGGKLWAVLVAGSNEYYNYRHQADICHAYQILHKHGIPDEQIVVMMYDDIAFNEQNPTPGIIINHINGTNVYPNVPKDYIGSTVTPKNFLNVLLGNEKAMEGIGSGKVLKSGPNDHVFVNFADHGAPGLVAFPNGELHVKDFMNTLKTMHKKKLYEKMVIYIEACESGSMFPKKLFSSDLNIFATTAANASESSYACYYDDSRETYLGDVYSVMWMEDSDVENLNKETLSKQFKIVKEETNTSNVQEFGDVNIGKMTVGDFQGNTDIPENANGMPLPKPQHDAVPSHDVPVFILKNKLQRLSANTEEYLTTRKQLHKLYSNRDFLEKVIRGIVEKSVVNKEQVNYALTERLELNNYDCYEHVVTYFSKNCFSLSKNDYALRHMYVFVNMCEMGIKARAVIKAMDLACIHPPIYGIY